jgi:hypothetical protein
MTIKISPHRIKLIRQGLKAHIRDTGFPREIFSQAMPKWKRKMVYSMSDLFYHATTAVKNQWDFHVGVYDEMQKVTQTIEAMFFDIDGPKHLEDNFNFSADFASRFGGRMIYSANKGFHVFIRFPISLDWSRLDPTVFKEYLVDYGFQIKDESSPYYLDTNVLLDIERVARAPFSLNPKSGTYVVPVDLKMSFSEVLAASKDPDLITSVPDADVNKGLEFFKFMPINLKAVDITGSEHAPTPDGYRWVEKLLARPVADGRHRLTWLVLAPYLVNVKKLTRTEAIATITEYIDRCKAVKDTDAEKTIEGFVDHAISAKLNPISLSRIKTQYPALYSLIVNAIN